LGRSYYKWTKDAGLLTREMGVRVPPDPL